VCVRAQILALPLHHDLYGAPAGTRRKKKFLGK
jgi:hypothetical protein